MDIYICTRNDSVWWPEAKQMDWRASFWFVPFDSEWNPVAVLLHKDSWVFHIYVRHLEKQKSFQQKVAGTTLQDWRWKIIRWKDSLNIDANEYKYSLSQNSIFQLTVFDGNSILLKYSPSHIHKRELLARKQLTDVPDFICYSCIDFSLFIFALYAYKQAEQVPCGYF